MCGTIKITVRKKTRKDVETVRVDEIYNNCINS